MYFGRLIAIFVGFIIFIVIMVKLFGHFTGKPATPAVAVKTLPDYAQTDASVSFTVDGIVNGDELHRSIRITVSSNQREVDVLQGYNPRVISSKTFINNEEAYTVFLKALNGYGFTSEIKNPKVSTDPSGYCPLGYRYILDLNQDGADVSNLWTSSCGTSVGNSNAQVGTVQQLFENQIPSYNSIVSGVDLTATSDQ